MFSFELMSNRGGLGLVLVLVYNGQTKVYNVEDEDHALQLSIDKWKAIVAECQRQADEGDYRRMVNFHGRTCALCEYYFDNGCGPCPIAIKTGLEDCRGTPYSFFSFSNENDMWDGRLLAAEAMVEFLKNLLISKDGSV